MSRGDYVSTLVDVVELLPPTCLIERISGDAPPDYLVGPAWCLDKPAILAALALLGLAGAIVAALGLRSGAPRTPKPEVKEAKQNASPVEELLARIDAALGEES